MRTVRCFGVALVLLFGSSIANAQVPVNPIPGAAPGRAVPGRMPTDNYQRYCAACHGAGGRPVMPDVPTLAFNQSIMTQPDLQIVNKLKAGSPKKPPFMGILSDRELLDLVAYIRTFR